MLLATARGDLDFKIQKPTQLLTWCWPNFDLNKDPSANKASYSIDVRHNRKRSPNGYERTDWFHNQRWLWQNWNQLAFQMCSNDKQNVRIDNFFKTNCNESKTLEASQIKVIIKWSCVISSNYFSKNDLVGNSDPTTTTMLLIYHDRVAMNTNRNIRKSLAQINSGSSSINFKSQSSNSNFCIFSRQDGRRYLRISWRFHAIFRR